MGGSRRQQRATTSAADVQLAIIQPRYQNSGDQRTATAVAEPTDGKFSFVGFFFNKLVDQ